MSASEPQLDRHQQRQKDRFERMGLAPRAMRGGRSLLVALPMGPTAFESVSGPLVIEQVVFSTVGADQIKCLRPRPVFGLPLIDIRRCADAVGIETLIREAWRSRVRALTKLRGSLGDLGIEASPIEGGSALAFELSGESPESQIIMQRAGEAILPSVGDLAGIPLDRMDHRVVDVRAAQESAADLECFLGARMQAVARDAKDRKTSRRREARRVGPIVTDGAQRIELANPVRHRPKILLVGPNVIEDATLRVALKSRGFRLATARSETEALARLASTSPDVVISEYGLGRSDGATLVQATRGLPGIERIPVVLLDDSSHQSRREAARAVGAAGYVVEPLSLDRFVPRIGQLIQKPGKRRFTRYPDRLAARLVGSTQPCLATEVGRGGVFLATDSHLSESGAMECEISFPELGRAMRFGGEVLYRNELQGSDRKGFGLRFADISDEDEASLIEYLSWLESSR